MKNKLLDLLENSDWILTKNQPEISFFQLQNGSDVANVYYSNMTIVFPMVKGAKTHGVYRNVKIDQFKQMFCRPDKGFMQKVKEWFH